MNIEIPQSKEDVDWNDLNKYQSILSLPEELWKAMKGILGDNFEVSNYGRCKRVIFTHKKIPPPAKIMKISDNGAGYKKFSLTFEGRLYNKYVHRVVAEYFIGNPLNLPQVNHTRDGLGKYDNRAEFLEWCTERDNILDAHDNGQMDYRTKVKTEIDIKSDEFVRQMYRVYKETGKVNETAVAFNVPRTTLSSIVNKRSRVNLTDAIDREFENRKLRELENNKGEINEQN